jgi:hypothetical protein
MLYQSFSFCLPKSALRARNIFLNNVQTQGEITTPYEGGVNDVQTRGKAITTAMSLRIENNLQSPGRYSTKTPKRRIELCRLDEWTTPLTWVQRIILQNYNKFKLKIKNIN